MKHMKRLIEALETERKRAHLTNAEFGQRFAHTGEWWSMIRTGRRTLMAFDARLAKRFWPDLQPLVDAYLLGDDDNDHVA